MSIRSWFCTNFYFRIGRTLFQLIRFLVANRKYIKQKQTHKHRHRHTTTYLHTSKSIIHAQIISKILCILFSPLGYPNYKEYIFESLIISNCASPFLISSVICSSLWLTILSKKRYLNLTPAFSGLCNFVVFTIKRCIRNPIQHLRWSIFLQNASSWILDRVLSKPRGI